MVSHFIKNRESADKVRKEFEETAFKGDKDRFMVNGKLDKEALLKECCDFDRI